ncbi:uncharacterized protein TNCV_3396351 [Trichonephila clavipes]|nr:uncharacterized protein TNCV_3396351 [Trichonephila clavipes]
MTPELPPPLLTTTPHQREDVSALVIFNVHRCPTRRVFSGTGLELVTRPATISYLYHSATTATGSFQTHMISLENSSVLYTAEELRATVNVHSRNEYQRRTVQLHEGFLAMDHVILNHGQVTWTTPELPPLPFLTTTPHQREDVSALDRFNVHRCPTRRVFSGTGLDLVTKPAMIRYLYHSASAAETKIRLVILCVCSIALSCNRIFLAPSLDNSHVCVVVPHVTCLT